MTLHKGDFETLMAHTTGVFMWFQPLQLCPTEPTRSCILPGSALPEISFSCALQQTQYQCILKASQQWLSRTPEVKNHWPEWEKGTYVVRKGEEGFLILPASIFF